MTDVDKFKRVLEVLPEERVRGVLDNAVYGYVLLDDIQMLNQFSEYAENKSSKFNHDKVQFIFKNFASDCTQVLGFIGEKVFTKHNRTQERIKLSKGVKEHFSMLASSLLNSFEELISTANWFLVNPLSINKESIEKTFHFDLDTGELYYDERMSKFDLDKKPYLLLKLLTSRVGDRFTYEVITKYFSENGVRVNRQDIHGIARQIRNTLRNNGVSPEFLYCNIGYQIRV